MARGEDKAGTFVYSFMNSSHKLDDVVELKGVSFCVLYLANFIAQFKS